MVYFRYFLVLIYCLLQGVLSVQAFAQTQSDIDLSDPEPVIEVAPKDETDKAIEKRIENIFDKIDSINLVTVSVSAGVVTLNGEVANEAAAKDAREIAIRTAGVVTVKDDINRTLDVSDNVGPVVKSFLKTSQNIYQALPLILISLFIFIFFVILGGFLARRKKIWQGLSPNPFLAEILSQAIRIGFWILGAIIALNLLGASSLIATILGGAGVLGIAIGFAVRDSLENYISSIMLSLRQPFRAKDHVIINDKEGIVVRLTSRATILMTMDGNHLRIPNSVVFKGTILNYTTNPERRFSFQLGVDAEDDPVSGMNVGIEAMSVHDFILTNPNPFAIIKTVGDSNIVLQFFGWVDQTNTDFGKARSQAIRSVKNALEENGFTLPEPIYRLRFDGRLPDMSVQESGEIKKSGTKIKQKPPLPVKDDIGVKKDTHLEEKINAERNSDLENDLLDEDRPTE